MGLKAWAAALVGALAAAGAAQAADSAKTAHVALLLAPQTVAAAPGSTLYVGLQETIAPGWHTYWRNPGDSGEPTAISWTLPAGWTAGPIVWPAPGRAATGPLVNYVYADKVILPTPIQVPASASPGSRAVLKAAVTYLVCKDVCIPEQASLDLSVPVASGAAKLSPVLGQAITETLAAAPKPAGLQARFARSGDAVSLWVSGAQLKGADVGRAWFYPYDGQLLDHAKPQQVAGGPDGLTLALPAGYGFTHGDPPKALDGVLALGGGKAWEVHATPGGPLPG
ncbi:MAG: thiol:disulfide interchange protein, partial [Caulobacteraceae bacterium]|nr:thiol:disulfide interchange protein [Caulobacter sp.]